MADNYSSIFDNSSANFESTGGTRQPIVVIDVTMHTGEQEQIVIFETDNPQMIVDEFC